MSIVMPYSECRKAVEEAATPLTHPKKLTFAPGADGQIAARHLDENGKPKTHPFGRIVYYGHGDWAGYVGVLLDGKYLVAHGDDHEDSIRQLAFQVGASKLDLGVKVSTTTEKTFYAHCMG